MLVTLIDMKAYLGIPELTTDYDAFLTEQIILISSAVENYCGRKFTETSYTQTFHIEDIYSERIESALYLYHYPTTNITSVVESISGDDTTLGTSEYRSHAPTSALYRLLSGSKSTWLSGGDATSYVEVVFEAGYATIPPEIDSVVKSLVAERYAKKSSGVELGFGNDVQRVSIPGTISIDFDYSLQTNERKNAFGMLIGNYGNVLDFFRSERAIIGTIKENYVA